MDQNDESMRVQKIRERLMQALSEGMVGVIAASGNLAEWALRDWLANPAHFLTMTEMILVEQALDRWVAKDR